MNVSLSGGYPDGRTRRRAKNPHYRTYLQTVANRTFGTRLIREGHDIVVVAELMGHKRLDQTRRYSLPTQADRENAILSLPTDR